MSRLTRRGKVVAGVSAGLVVAGAAAAGFAVATGYIPAPWATSVVAAPAPTASPSVAAVVAARWGAATPDLGGEVGVPIHPAELRDLVASAPVVVVGPFGSATAELLAAQAAEQLRAPVLGGMDVDLLAQWKTRIVVLASDAADGVPAGIEVRRLLSDERPRAFVEDVAGDRPFGSGAPERADPETDLGELARQAATTERLPQALALVDGLELTWQERATLAAIGVAPVAVADGDPRTAAASIAALPTTDTVVLFGPTWVGRDTSDVLWQVATARSGHELPGGGQLLFPMRRLVALYGHPEGGALGVLGERGLAAAVDRTREVAASYAAISELPILPTFELIATVASAGASERGDYSRRTPIEQLRPWVEAAADAGIYVVLDLQPGRTDFLTQAREYEEFLRLPHVGLGLDPEWRLRPNERHLRQIGSVAAAEVNEVSAWLAALTREARLPQKLLIVHQFKHSMIRDRATLVVPPELALVIQMDGQGSAGSKVGTYRALIDIDPPSPSIRWGWKNFYDEDQPLRSPAATLQLDPVPWFISYQ